MEKERFFLERKCLEELFSRGWGEGGCGTKTAGGDIGAPAGLPRGMCNPPQPERTGAL